MKLSQTIALTFVFFAVFGIVLSQIGILLSTNSWVVLLICSAAVATVIGVIQIRQRQAEPDLAKPAASNAGLAGSAHLAKMPPYSSNSSRPMKVVVDTLPWLILVPPFVAMFLSTRTQLMPHGYLNSGYIYQVLNGQLPPDNVVLPGYPANYYWYYHALVAVISELAEVTPPFSATILSAIALVATLILLRAIVANLIPQEKRSLVLTILAFFSLFGMNLFGSIHALLIINSASNQSLLTTLTGVVPKSLFGDPRLTAGLDRYLAMGSTSLGLLAFVLVILVILKILTGEVRGLEIFFAFMATFAALAFHPMEGMLIAVAIPTALLVTYFLVALMKGDTLNVDYHKANIAILTAYIREHRVWTLVAGVILVVAGLATLRFLLGAASTREGGFSFDLIALSHAKSIISMTYALIPFFLLSAYHAFKSVDTKLIFLISLTVIGLAMGYALRYGNNEYKFIFTASIAMCTVCTVSIWHYVFRPANERNWLGYSIGLLMLALMFLNLFTIGTSMLAKTSTRADNFLADGVHINSRTAYQGIPVAPTEYSWAQDNDGNPYPTDLQYADIFQWARDNTHAEAVLVVPLTHVDHSSLYVLSERLPYVAATVLRQALPEHSKRMEVVSQLYSTEDEGIIGEAVLALDYIRDDLPGREKYLLYPLYKTGLASNPARYGLELVFEGRHANLYEISAD